MSARNAVRWNTLKIHWFLPALPVLPGLFGVLCWAAPAWAGELSSWQFDRNQNLLEFTTDEGVQPRAQLVPDPTRLVIDLPGTTIGEARTSQLIGGAIQQVRIAQFDANTTRIVVELAPGYSLDPQQVQFRGISPTQWTVQLPSPEYVSAPAPAAPATNSLNSFVNPPVSSSVAPAAPASPTVAMPPVPASSSVGSSGQVTPPAAVSPAAASPAVASRPAALDPSLTQIEGLSVTDDGLFIRVSGAPPVEVEVDRSRDRRSISLEIENAVLSPQFTQPNLTVEQFDIDRLEFKQEDNSSPTVEITLEVDRDSPNWFASISGLGGIVLLPQGRIAAASRSLDRSASRDQRNPSDQSNSPEPARPTPQPDPPVSSLSAQSTAAPAPAFATIAGIELDVSGTQLLIHSDRPVNYSGRWQSGMYQVSLSPARLAEQVTGPQLDGNSPLLRVRLRQEEDDTVVINIQPASGVRFGTLNAVTPQLLSLEMQRSVVSPTISSTTPTDSGSTAATPARSNSNIALPQVSNGRLVVVIDPGHGGPDVGAVGIGDIYEADIVLSIAMQVGALLQQQGIQVVMTRTDNSDIDLEPRVQLAEQVNATLFVSIHANSMGLDRPDINGAETYYYSSGEALAEVIQNSIVSNVGMNDRGVRQARFYVLRRTSMPAVLVETGYVTGEEDAPRLANASFQTQMAWAIAQGILTYLQQNASTQGI